MTIITYTHSNCSDLWPMYFGQLNKYLPGHESYVMSDKGSYPGHKFWHYDDNTPYWKYMVKFIKRLKCKYFLYMQEDFIITGDIDHEKLSCYLDFLDESGYSYLKLVAGDLMGFDHIRGDIYKVPTGHPYFFSMQASIWNRKDFIRMYKEAKCPEYRERIEYTHAALKLKLKGSFCYHGQQQKRGKYHYDSLVFPSIATATVKKRWNTLEYKKELTELAEEYNIDLKIRGENIDR